MTTSQIKIVLNSFNISQSDIDSRTKIHEFANSISEILVDKFVENYLLNNSELSIYLAHTDAARLVKNIKTFVAFILTAPIDEIYIKRIHYIGSIHFSIKLEPAKVSYGFWCINEVLNDLADVNDIVKENKSLISKILRFVEHVMNDGYYIQEKDIEQTSLEKQTGFNTQNELYLAFEMHKQNMKKIETSISSENYSIENIIEDANLCPFGKVLHTIMNNDKYQYILGLDLKNVINLHNQWHEEFSIFKKYLSNDDKKNIKISADNISKLTDQLKQILDNILQESLKDGHNIVNSGIRAMKNMTNIFRQNTIYDNFDEMFNQIFSESFNEFYWAIDDVYINFQKKANSSYDIVKMLRHNSKNIYIGIKLKENKNNDYINEMILMLIDIMELHFSSKERERSLITFADKAENANKSKDIFLANMSHELRTPLNAINGFSQILMMKKDVDTKTKSYVEKINIAGNHLLDLVNTILDFAKLEAGKMQFNPTLSNIANIINEVSMFVKPLAEKKNINLHLAKIVSLNLYIDEKLFKQVLINLLTNAIKFTNEGGDVSLNIIYDYDSHSYKFEVKDNGIGLSKKSISKLFQAFSQIDSSYQKQQQGTGLGLMISKKIIEDLHSGKIWVESVENEGSTFYISMPTHRVKSTTYSINEAPDNARKALIVEDSTSYQKILAEHLKDSVNLTFTDTVNKAKDLLTNNTYDFLILDFFLLDGISSEILLFMEEENILIPTIVISAEDEIHISSSLSGSSNLEGIMNKNNIDNICASIKGNAYEK